ncbi:FtsW/RodA/SpoVE family cell cycle protein [[Clostridium] colinum]|uniref:FtsW/RodA/SpoVE family cell cycle protein n=1 Tax=[Clostridium] colinum TaxID=36835 RepID=UPI00202480FD|nr:FtsW/RodA/SpoVE family cell cycle protein [[Clostridium] colinum]
MFKKKLLYFDYLLVILVFCMVIIGITAIGSANRINTLDIGFNKEFLSSEFVNQIIWFIIGIFAMLLAAFIDYRFIAKFYIPIYIVNLILLFLVLSPLGKTINGVKRWIFGIQPSEFCKIFMIIFIAKFIENNKETINELKTLFILCLLTIFPVILIKAQPSLSASLVILSILVFQIFAGNLDFKYIKIILIIFIPIILILAIDIISGKYFILGTILKDYQLERISSIVSFDLNTTDSSLYQTKNSAWAIGSGQLMGKGLFNGSMNQLNYIPYSHNDFIFAVIGEEFGFVGCCIVILLSLLIIGKCLIIANKSIDMLGTLIVVGVVGMLAFQIFVNIGVATSLLPNTGMPFPFLSAGGSSMLINMSCIGLVLNVGMTKPKNLFEK